MKAEMEGTENPRIYRLARRRYLAKEEGKCDRCPPHAKENERRKARPDRHKNRDRQSIRMAA